MAKSKFKITPFTNPSGSNVFRVTGTLNGKTIRKNFKDRASAVAYRQKLQVESLNSDTEGKTVWTTLTQEQNHDAIAAVNILKSAGIRKSLAFAATYFAKHFREAEGEAVVEDAVESYVEQRLRDHKRGLISSRQHDSILREFHTFKKVFRGRMVGEIHGDELKAYLEGSLEHSRRAVSLKTWNNRRGYLSTFFKFCRSSKWTAQDPVIEVPQYKIKHSRGTAPTLSAVEVERLMHWLETYTGHTNKDGSPWGKPGCMVPYFALTFFAGIRPDFETGEMRKLRPEHLRFDTEVILIEPGVSKVREKRVIKMQPNLRAWLEKYPPEEYPFLPARRLRHLFRDVRAQHSLPHDVMRHTYISMLVGAFRSIGDAALQAGNSEAIIRKHYLDLKSVEEADQFWRILPKGVKLPQLKKSEGRYVPTRKRASAKAAKAR